MEREYDLLALPFTSVLSEISGSCNVIIQATLKPKWESPVFGKGRDMKTMAHSDLTCLIKKMSDGHSLLHVI